MLTGVPTFWAQLVQFLDRHPVEDPLAAVRLLVSSGDSLPAPVADAVGDLGGEGELRRRPDGGDELVTDNGNWILDVRFAGGIDDPPALERELATIPGLVESGLFIGLADVVIIGGPSGVEVRETGRAAGGRRTG